MTQMRKARHWSQAKLAREAEMNQATMSQIENARLRPYESQLAKIAKALGVDPAQAAGLMEVTQEDD